MKELVGAVVLRNRETGAVEPAEVYRGLDQKNFDDFVNRWKPMLENREDQPALLSTAAKANAPDFHWKWVEKAAYAARSLQYETFAVECAGVTQGLMLVDVTKFAQLDSQRGHELVYIELLATAPWNRPRLVPKPQYKGAGRILIGTAISLSIELGFKGRIGLHSLDGAESWYKAVGSFTDGGYDPVKKMQYFEMTEAQATESISG